MALTLRSLSAGTKKGCDFCLFLAAMVDLKMLLMAGSWEIALEESEISQRRRESMKTRGPCAQGNSRRDPSL